jgi:hypothetical protein
MVIEAAGREEPSAQGWDGAGASKKRIPPFGHNQVHIAVPVFGHNNNESRVDDP